MRNGTQYATALLKRMQRRKAANKRQRDKYRSMHRTAWYTKSGERHLLQKKKMSVEALEKIKMAIRLQIRREKIKNTLLFVILTVVVFGLLISFL